MLAAPAPNLTRHLVGGGLWGCRSRKEHRRRSLPSMGLFSGCPAIWEVADPRSTLPRYSRVIPLNTPDGDFLGVSVVRTVAVPFRAPARTRIAPQRARPVAVPTLGRSGLCVGSTLRSRCDIRERERWAAFPACSQPRSQAFTAACRSQPSFTTACRSQPPCPRPCCALESRLCEDAIFFGHP